MSLATQSMSDDDVQRVAEWVQWTRRCIAADVVVRNMSLLWTILFSRFERPLTLIFVFNYRLLFVHLFFF